MKVKLPKNVCEALEIATFRHVSPASVVRRHLDSIFRWEGDCEVLNSVKEDDLIKALYIGYEPIEEDKTVTITPYMKEAILDNYKHVWGNSMKAAVHFTLTTLNIKIKGVNTND